MGESGGDDEGLRGVAAVEVDLGSGRIATIYVEVVS
jgi:hypothetical protein